MAIQHIVRRFEVLGDVEFVPSFEEWRTTCPSCLLFFPEKRPGCLVITEPIPGRAHVRCGAGCTSNDITEALGLPYGCLLPKLSVPTPDWIREAIFREGDNG